MAEAYRTGLDRSVERAAVGRRTSEAQIDCVNLLFPGQVDLCQPPSGTSNFDLPRLDELVTSVRDYLRTEVMSATRGRTSFMARVAANSLDVVLRDLAVGETHRERQRDRLRGLVGRDGDLEKLKWTLVEMLRDGSMDWRAHGLAEYLRESVVNQTAIDQPSYSGLKTAVNRRV